MKITRWSVIWHNAKGEIKSFESNSIELVERKAVIRAGTVYEQTRYRAMLRLQQRYIKLRYEGRLPEVIDYPQFL